MEQSVPVLEAMLLARGLKLSRYNPLDDLLLPPSGSSDDLEAYRNILDHFAARLLLKEIIIAADEDDWVRGRKNVERFADTRAIDKFLLQYNRLGVISSSSLLPSPSKPVRSFGPTCEWYVASVITSGFKAPSIWGVTLENTGSGGDFDVLSCLSGHFVYLEVKTSPPGRIEAPEIGGFVRRLFDTAPDLAVFLNDTHLRMKDKIVPMMEEEITQCRVQGAECRGQHNSKPQFERLEREIFHLGGAIYIINSKPDLKRNLEVIFRHYFRERSAVLEILNL